jgi:hypothetical protein
MINLREKFQDAKKNPFLFVDAGFLAMSLIGAGIISYGAISGNFGKYYQSMDQESGAAPTVSVPRPR